MAQISYGTITITDTTDIERIYPVYCKGGENSAPSLQPLTNWSENVDQASGDGDYIWQRIVTKKQGITVTANDYSDAVRLTGETGAALTIINTQYAQTQGENDTPSWNNFMPSQINEGYWLWVKVTYSDTSEVVTKIKQGQTGPNGINTATIYLYQRNNTTPNRPTNNLTYTFSTKVLSGTINNGWSTDLGSLTGANPLWVIAAVASSNGTEDVINRYVSSSNPGDWSTPIKLAENTNRATVYIYQRAASVSKPTATTNYKFSDGSFTVPSGWSTSIPASSSQNQNPCWVTSAIAVGNTDTATLNWVNPSVLVENGEDGFTPTVTQTSNGVTITRKDGTTVAITNGNNGDTYYTHIRYSANSNGSNYQPTPDASRPYIGIYSGTESSPPAYNVQGWTWSKYLGTDGTSILGTKEIYCLMVNSNNPPSLSNGSDISQSSDTVTGQWTTNVPKYVANGIYWISIQTHLDSSPTWVYSAPIKNQALTDENYRAWEALSVSQSANENAIGAMSQAAEAQYQAEALDTKLKTFFWPGDNNYPGAYAVGKSSSDGLDIEDISTYGYNVRLTPATISIGYNEVSAILIDGSSPTLKFYPPSKTVRNPDNPTMTLTSSALTFNKVGTASKTVELTNGALNFYGSSTSTADATLTSTGLKLVKGGLEAGSKNTTDYIYVWSTDDATNHKLTINNHEASDWRIIAGNKFGVDKAGNLYASGATINGAIVATSLDLTTNNVKINYSSINNTPDLSVYISKDGVIGTEPSDSAASSSTGFKVSSAGLLKAANAVITGKIFASSGTIGGWNISTDNNKSLYYGNSIPGATTNNLVLSPVATSNPTTNTNAIAGSGTGKTWFISAGQKFGVDTSGTLYATGAKLDTITATNFSLNSGSIDSTVTIGNKAQSEYLNSNIEIGGRNKAALSYIWSRAGSTYTTNGITFTNLGGGRFSAVGTATNAGDIWWCNADSASNQLGTGGTYTYTIYLESGTMPSNIGLQVAEADSTPTWQRNNRSSGGATTYIFSTLDGNHPYHLGFWAVAANTAINITFRLKFEEGNKSTDWSPAPEDVQAEIDGIEVGGRNLLKDSANLIGGWTFDGGSTRGTGSATLPSTGDGMHRIYQLPSNGYWSIWQANTTYTVSIEAKASASGLKFLLAPYGGGVSEKTVTLTTSWARYSYTFTTNSNTSTASCSFINSGNASGSIEVRNPKLEIGNKATDWTPAPEDVQSEIDAKKSVHTLNTTYSYTYAQLLTYSNEYTTDWTVSSTSGVKVGDTVRLKMAVSNMSNAPVYIVGTVTSIDSETRLHITSHGLDTTIIDGGNIITNSIGANQIAANAIDTTKLTVGTQNDVLNSNVKIGGTNLFGHGTECKSLGGFTLYGVWDITTEDGFTCAHTSGVIGNTKNLRSNIPFTPKPKETVTFSAYIKIKNIVYGTTNPMCEFYFSGQTIDGAWRSGTTDAVYVDGVKVAVNSTYPLRFTSYISDTNWHHIAFVRTWDNYTFGDLPPYIYLRDATGDLYVRNIKYERGNKATDWTPAPEDIDVHQYVTRITDAGIRIHPSSTENNSVVINSDGVEIFKGGTTPEYSVAKYSDTIQIGQTTGENINFITIDEYGLKIYKDQSDIAAAEFGSIVRIGNEWQVEIGGDSINIIDNTGDAPATVTTFNGEGITFFDGLGTAEKNIIGEFGINGATIGAEGSTTRAKFTADAFEIKDSSLLNILKIGKGEQLENTYDDYYMMGGGSIKSSSYVDYGLFQLTSTFSETLHSPTSTITVTIPWKNYTSTTSSTSGTTTFTFSPNSTETKTNGPFTATYNSTTSLLTIQAIGTTGTYTDCEIRDYAASSDRTISQSFTSGQSVYGKFLMVKQASLDVHYVIKFTGNSTKTYSFNHTFSYASLNALAIGNVLTVTQTYTSQYKFTVLVRRASSSNFHIYIRSSQASGSYGIPQLNYINSYVTYPITGVLIEAENVRIKYDGTADAPYYNLGHRKVYSTTGAYSFILGQNLEAPYPRSMVIGQYNDASEDYMFTVANGTNQNALNLFTVNPTGNVKASGSLTVSNHDSSIGTLLEESASGVSIASGADSWRYLTGCQLTLTAGSWIITYSAYCSTLASGKRLAGALKNTANDSIWYGSRSMIHTSNTAPGAVSGVFPCVVTGSSITVRLMVFQTQGNAQDMSGYIRAMRIA